MNFQQRLSDTARSPGRPVSGVGLVALVLFLATVPGVLFFDSLDNVFGQGHLPREPMPFYRLWSDDVAFAGVGRSWHRTFEYLFVPHNTHVVPAWRVLVWALVAAAGSLERLPDVLAVASFSILIAVMLLMARIVTRETGRAFLGFVAMIVVGTSSLMLTPVVWFSAGQPLWAGFGILATLWYAQSYRRTGHWINLLLAGIAAMLGGWCWTIGYMAGPVSTVYLWLDGRTRCRKAAIVPMLATMLAVGMSAALGLKSMDSTISFHGKTALEAMDPARGVTHTGQAIPENLVLGNLGLHANTTPLQGGVLTLVLLAIWLGCRWDRDLRKSGWVVPFAINPLESAGLTLVVGAYLVEWTFRGYLDFSLLRTIGLRALIPWYDAIPQIGAVLFAAGWCSGRWRPMPVPKGESFWRSRVTRAEGLWLVSIAAVMLLLNSPRVEDLVRRSVPSLLPSEAAAFHAMHMQTMRANTLMTTQAEWQRAALRRLDRAEKVAKKMGIGRDVIRGALGRALLVGSFASKPPLELLGIYDSAALLDIPETGRQVDAKTVQAALRSFFIEEPEPRPTWLERGESWPPPVEDPRSRK
jgi:hypothetical protein